MECTDSKKHQWGTLHCVTSSSPNTPSPCRILEARERKLVVKREIQTPEDSETAGACGGEQEMREQLVGGIWGCDNPLDGLQWGTSVGKRTTGLTAEQHSRAPSHLLG